MTAAKSPTSWLTALEPHLVDKTTVPYVCSPELFSLQEMAGRLAGLFHLSGGQLDITSPQKCLEPISFSDPPSMSFKYKIGNLPEAVFWIIHHDEAERLVALLLKGKQEVAPELDADLVDAFMRYFSLEILLHLRALGFAERLLIECMGAVFPPKNASYARLSISWNIQGAAFASTLILPESFIEHWNRHFEQEHLNQPLSDALADQVLLVIHLDIGAVTLTQHQWQEMQVGDFLLLDQCTLIPGKDKGRVRLSAANTPLFRAMVKEGSIKLLEHSVYQEMEPSMSQNLPEYKPAASSDEELEEESWDEQSEEASGEESEEETEEETEEEWSEEESAEESEYEEESEEESDEDSLSNEEIVVKKSPPPSQQLKPPKALPTDTVSSSEEPLTSLEQIPFTLIIEVGRLKMSLSHLRKLQPGDVLDIAIDPTKGVDLVIEGRTIGRAELLRLGESIGVRVTEIG